MNLDQMLGYLCLNACVFSEHLDPSNIQIEHATTDEAFYIETHYDLFRNIFELIQAYGPQQLNLDAFEEGFKQGYWEKEEQWNGDLADYFEYWELAEQFLETYDQQGSRRLLLKEVSYLLAQAVHLSETSAQGDYHQTLKTDYSFYQATAFDLVGAALNIFYELPLTPLELEGMEAPFLKHVRETAVPPTRIWDQLTYQRNHLMEYIA